MKLLITGASGFIGRRALSQAIERPEIEVVAAARRPEARPGASFVEVDLLSPGEPRRLIELCKPTHLLHLAWNAVPGVFWNTPQNLAWCSASLDLLLAFAENGGKRAVMAGSCAEYDWRGAARLSESQSPLAPATLYGVAKDALRRMTLYASGGLGLSIGWGRVFWLYGPGEPAGRLVSDTARALADGRPAETSPGMQMRDFMHVDDVAGAFVAALFSNYTGAFNIGSGEAVRVRDVVTALAGTLGAEQLLRLGARPAASDEPPCLFADVRILREEIGFSPRLGLSEGLRETALWWREGGVV